MDRRLPVLLLYLLVSCSGRLLIPREYRESVQSIPFVYDGIERENLLYIPSSVKPAPPLLLVFHGGAGRPTGMTRMDEGRLLGIADEQGFIIGYPEGVGRSWNDYREDPISEAHKSDRDDTGFIRAFVAELVRRYGIDRNRVYVAGISNGGFFSVRLACEASDVIAGAVVVTAQLPKAGLSRCKPERPVDLIFINGTDDPLVPYAGGNVEVFGKKRGWILSTDDTLAFFAKRYGCSAHRKTALPVKDVDDPTLVIRHDWTCPSSLLQLYEIQGGGHTWPGGIQYLGEGFIGRVSHQIEASVIVADLVTGRSGSLLH